MRTISEPDWKVFRKLQPVALERFCQRILAEIAQVAADGNKTNHERYLAVYRLIQRRDKQVAEAFNDLRRSTAYLQLAVIQSHGLLTEEEMARFSPEARAVVQVFLGPGQE
jgi:hypothetical protein